MLLTLYSKPALIFHLVWIWDTVNISHSTWCQLTFATLVPSFFSLFCTFAFVILFLLAVNGNKNDKPLFWQVIALVLKNLPNIVCLGFINCLLLYIRYVLLFLFVGHFIWVTPNKLFQGKYRAMDTFLLYYYMFVFCVVIAKCVFWSFLIIVYMHAWVKKKVFLADFDSNVEIKTK